MADNPFSVRVPSIYEALLAGDKGYDTGRQVMQDHALRSAAPDLASGNYQNALARLMQGGNLQGALAVAHLANSDRDYNFRLADAARNQKNTEFNQKLAAKNAEEKPQYMQIEAPDGSKQLVKIDPFGKGVTAVQPQGMNTTPNNPFMTGGAMNEAQSKDALYANRMLASERVLRGVESAGQSWWERAKAGVANATGYNVNSPQYQKFDQAQRDFINATLRRESGAVISPSEFDNANKQYFPQPGDSPDVLKQKRANRMEAIKGIGAGAGKGYNPPLGFDAAGNIVERNKQVAQSAPGGPVKVGSPQERDALLSGTQYIAPDGSVRTKR